MSQIKQKVKKIMRKTILVPVLQIRLKPLATMRSQCAMPRSPCPTVPQRLVRDSQKGSDRRAGDAFACIPPSVACQTDMRERSRLGSVVTRSIALLLYNHFGGLFQQLAHSLAGPLSTACTICRSSLLRVFMPLCDLDSDCRGCLALGTILARVPS